MSTGGKPFVLRVWRDGEALPDLYEALCIKDAVAQFLDSMGYTLTLADCPDFPEGDLDSSKDDEQNIDEIEDWS